MSRYDLNLRKRWQNPAFDNIGDAIGQAAAGIEKNHDADTAEQNEMAKLGATQVPGSEPEGGFAKLRRIGGQIKDRFTGGGAPPSVQPGPVVQPDMSRLQPPRIPQGGPQGVQIGGMQGGRPGEVTPDDGGRPYSPPVQSQGSMFDRAIERTEGTGQQPPPADRGMPGVQGVRVGPDAGPAPKSISSALDQRMVTLEGRGGRKYQYDANRPARDQFNLHEAEADAADRRVSQRETDTETRRAVTQRSREDESIRDAVAAGMTPAEARLRVRNGLLRYDDVYGQQRGTPGQMTPEQKFQLQTQRDKAAMERARVMADPRASAAERQNAQLALQTAEAMLRMAGSTAKPFTDAANDAAKDIPHGVDRIVEESTPEGKARVAAAESTRAANRDSAGRIIHEGATRASGAMPAARGKTYTPEQTRSRAQALQAQAGGDPWKTYDTMVAEGYSVNPPKTPRKAAAPKDTGNIDLRK